MFDFKKGDIIFFVFPGDTIQNENICQVEDIKDDVVKTSKGMTLLKILSPQGQVQIAPLPLYLLNSNKKDIYIDLKQALIYGIVENEDILNTFHEFTSGIVIPKVQPNFNPNNKNGKLLT